MAAPKGATLVTEPEAQQAPQGPRGAFPLTRQAINVIPEIRKQTLAGINDVTALLALPFESAVGTLDISTEGVEAIGPEETARRRAEGEIGIPGMATEEPTGPLSRGARMAGQTAAVAPMLGTALGFVTAPAGFEAAGVMAGQVTRTLAEIGATFGRAPALATAGETALGFTAGFSGGVAGELFPDSDAAVFVGDIFGGVAPTLTPIALAVRAAGGARNLVERVRHPFQTSGGRKRAAARVQRATPKEARARAVAELDRPTTIDPETGKPVLTPAQQSQDPGFLSIEKSIVESSEDLTRQADLQIAHANQVIQQSLKDVGGQVPPSAVETQIVEAHRYLDSLVDTRIRIAAHKTEQRIASLGSTVSRQQANEIAEEEVRTALAAASKQSEELWALVPFESAAPTKNAVADFLRIIKGGVDTKTGKRVIGLSKAQMKNIPEEANKLLNPKSKGFLGPETTVLELRGLQSELRASARNARTGPEPNFDKARIADSIADAIDDDLMQSAAGPEGSDAISLAVNFTRNMKERFNQGPVAKILGRTKGEGRTIDPELALEKTIGASGPDSAVAMRRILKAFDSPEAPSSATLINATQDFMRHKFLQKAVEKGHLNERAAERFLRDNAPLLEKMPQVRREIEEVLGFNDPEVIRGKIAQRRQRSLKLDDPRVSKATMLIEKGPVETFRQIGKLRPRDAATETQKLINRASVDATGEALQGLKSGFIDNLYQAARQGSQRDVAGTPILSGFAFRDALAEPGMRSAANKLFTPDELNRLGIVTRDLIRIERRLATKPAPEGVISDTASSVLEAAAGIAGAAVGRNTARHAGAGGTVQIPGILAARFREMLAAGVQNPARRLLVDMVHDEKLWKELAMAPIDQETKEISEQATRRLNAWAAVVIMEHGGELDAPEQGFDESRLFDI